MVPFLSNLEFVEDYVEGLDLCNCTKDLPCTTNQ